tara:strand:+ start:267 stop:1316 length:1050 start_codon:yes stop_codon:yes gene_type:complete
LSNNLKSEKLNQNINLAIVSTTINGEKGYLPFDSIAKKSKFNTVKFFISGDKKSLAFDISKFQCDVEYIEAKAQKKYHCSESIGWNKIMRRNIALLKAIEKEPDFILMIDDDNVPSDDYFNIWHKIITNPSKKLEVINKNNSCWYNYLESSDAIINIYPRGYPLIFRGQESNINISSQSVFPEEIGLYQGISLGDPDIDAITRIMYPKPIGEIRIKNYCCKNIWSPYNTQNTMFSKILFPLAFVWPRCGRYDDIYSSFAWQKYLFNNDLFVHVGDSVNMQYRGKRDIFIDFQMEVEGMMNAHLVWRSINEISEKDAIKFIVELANSENSIINRHKNFFLAYLKDLETVL